MLQGWWHNASHERGQVSAGLVVVRCYRDGRLEQALYREKGLEASMTDVLHPTGPEFVCDAECLGGGRAGGGGVKGTVGSTCSPEVNSGLTHLHVWTS